MIFQSCYYLVYIIGTYIFEQFCDTIYNSKRDLGFKATLLVILYSFIFSLSYFGDLLITAIFLVYSNFVFSILCYKCKWHFAFINSVIATIVMILCNVRYPCIIIFYNTHFVYYKYCIKSFGNGYDFDFLQCTAYGYYLSHCRIILH